MAPATPHRSAAGHLSLISRDEVSPPDAKEVLIAAFSAEDYIHCIKNLHECKIGPQAYIDGLDQIIDALPSGSAIYYRGVRALRKTCGIYGLIPSSHSMSGALTLVTVGDMKRPFASGGYSDVWKATDGVGHIFAIKQLRICMVDDLANVKKKYCKEVTICRRIKHENVLGTEGVAPGLFEMCLVSKWMQNGNMLEYVRYNQEVDRMRLLIGITRGLHHLHSNEVIHGDLKGECHFCQHFNPSHTGGTIRWSAPELLDGLRDKKKKQTPTAKSDVYALSMAIVELYSGNIPFPEKSDPNVVIVVLKGQRPPKPPSAQPLGLTPAVWRLTRRCWLKNAAKRPDADEVLARLEGMWDSSGDCGADDVDDDVSLYGVNQKMSPEESKAKLLFAKAEYKAQKAMDHAERQAKRVKKQRPKTTDGDIGEAAVRVASMNVDDISSAGPATQSEPFLNS